MAKDAGNTRSLTDYVVSVADVGSTLPTDATTATDAAFTEVGLVSDGGFTKGRTENTSEVFDAAGRKVRTFRSQATRTFTFTALESNAVVKELEEPGAVTVTGGRQVKDAPPARRAVVLDYEDTATDGTEITTRIVIPEAEIVPSGEPVRVDGQIEGYQFTVSTMKTDDGTHYYEYETTGAV